MLAFRRLRRAWLGLLLVPPSAAAGLWACGDDTVTAPLDGGSDATAADVTIDVPPTPHEAGEAGEEASCVVFDAGPLDDASVAAGEALVTAYKCNKCHGNSLSGNANGVQSSQTEGGLAYPPNLTPDPATGLGCWTNAQIENAILNGVDDLGQPLCPPMPHFVDAGLDASGVNDLLEYLRSLAPVVMTVPPTPSCVTGPPAEAGTDGATDGGVNAGDGGPDAGDAETADGADASGE